MKRILPLIIICFPIVLWGQTFTFSTAIDHGESVSETVDGVTLTFTNSSNNAALTNGGGYAGSSGNVIFTESSNTSTTATLTFSSVVNVISLFAMDGDGVTGSEWSFTPTGGSNSNVQQNINASTGSTVILNWTNVTAITVTSTQGGETFAFDDVNFNTNHEPTAANFTVTPTHNLVHKFTTTNFSYSDDNSDPIDHLRVTAIPENGTLYIDADLDNTYDIGEELANGNTVSKANLDAGNLQYYNTNGISSSFAFDVSDGIDYSASTYTVKLTVLKVPEITFENITKTYGDPDFELNATVNSGGTISYSIQGVANGTSLSGTNSITATLGNAGAITIRAIAAANGEYAAGSKDITLTINKATSTITWVDPADIVYGTALSETELNATSPVAGTFVYTPPLNTILDAGDGQALSVEFTPSDTANYNQANSSVFINVALATGVEDISDLGISIYPNPTNGLINFKTKNNIIEKITVSYMTGKEIVVKTQIQQNEILDLSNFESGIYIISIQTDEKIFVKPIVKK